MRTRNRVDEGIRRMREEASCDEAPALRHVECFNTSSGRLELAFLL